MSHLWWAGEQLKDNTIHKGSGEIMGIPAAIKAQSQSFRIGQGFFKSPENKTVESQL